MSTQLNLSRYPFRNRVLPWTVTALISLISIVALLYIAQATMSLNTKTLAAQREVADLRKETETLNKRAKEVETALTPEERRDLKSAHALVDRKRFSWSQLFADLENSLPGGVRVTRIAVKEVTMQDDRPVADLELVVSSKTSTVVTEMIQNMQSEGTFQAELVAQNPQRGKDEIGSEYELAVHYVPRAGIPVAPDAKRPVDTANRGGKAQ
jgi:Tfp pilus assembly protein PilN